MNLTVLSGLPTRWFTKVGRCALLTAGVTLAGCDSPEVAEQPAEVNDPVAATDAPEPDQPIEVATLGIGDPAPDLQVDQWVTGEQVDSALSDGVYVVEFWATWCGPCLRGMPHISELQEHYGDEVKFVGVTREDVETVTEFLERESPDGTLWSEVVKYRLVTDSNDATSAAYMKAANQNGIPTAFIVGRDGIIEWIGHPMTIDDPLQRVVDGNWDRDAAVSEFNQRQRLREMSGQLQRWLRNGKWDQALSAVDRLEQETGRTVGLLQYKMMILEGSGDTEAAESLRTEIVDLAWDDASALNSIAWNVASQGKTNALELARRAAERASELRDNKDPGVMDTVARVHYELGDLEQAIRWQQLAVENNSGMEQINKTLEKYLAEQGEAAQAEGTEPEDSESAKAATDDEVTDEVTDDEASENESESEGTDEDESAE